MDRSDGEPRGEVVRFDEEGGRTKFLDELERWKVKVALNEDNWQERAGKFLKDVTWEPVDDQHILHACQEIAPMEVDRAGVITEKVFVNRFLCCLAYTVVYDDPAYYVHESRQLKHTTLYGGSLQRWKRQYERCGNCGNTMANPQEPTRMDLDWWHFWLASCPSCLVQPLPNRGRLA